MEEQEENRKRLDEYEKKQKDSVPKYYVYYYIDDDLKHIFEYNEFYNTVKAHIYTQSEIEEYCITDEEKEERERKKREEEEEKKRQEEEKNKKETFLDSLKNHTYLWITIFIFIFTTLLGIIGIIILICRIHRIKHPRRAKPVTGKMQELTSKFITQSEVQT